MCRRRRWMSSSGRSGRMLSMPGVARVRWAMSRQALRRLASVRSNREAGTGSFIVSPEAIIPQTQGVLANTEAAPDLPLPAAARQPRRLPRGVGSARSRAMKWVRRAGWALAAVLLLAAVAAGGGYLWLRTSLPQPRGTLARPTLPLGGATARAANGIVTIRAETEAEAYYALGSAHAQDRLFQMDLMRRLGAGRLSEVIGGATVDTDRMMRLFGFYRL